MLSGLRWLALEVWFLDRAREFYARHLDAPVVRETDDEVVLDVGGAELLLREPGPVPRGGVHVHFALATPPDRYGAWYDRLAGTVELDEVDFGGAKSLYFYDPDDHCVEIGQRGVGDASRDSSAPEAPAARGEYPLEGIFEVVLEVEALEPAEAFYRDLGFAVADRGEERRRVRLTGPVDLELWEPQRGLADARGGVHVDVGFAAPDPAAAADAVSDRVCDSERVDGGVRVRDPDGHYLTFLEG